MGTHSTESDKGKAMGDEPVRVVAAACDGACRGNPGPGGWGALLRYEDGRVQELGGADPATTNNRMELTAALALLQALRSLPRHPELVIRTDSRYLIDGLQRWMPGWKRKGWRTASGGPVLNQDLWEQLDQARLAGLRLVHVRGHSGDPDNDRCDAIAVAFSLGRPPTLAQAGTAALAGAAPGAAASDSGSAHRETSLLPDSAGASGSGSSSGSSAGLRRDAGGGSAAATTGGGRGRRSSGSGQDAPPLEALSSGQESPPEDVAPAGLTSLLSRLELADRLARGGYSLSLVELAQLVELPLRSLEPRRSAWTWRDWQVLPLAEGRWRLERGAGGYQDPQDEPGA
ncbi:MAG: ribonuclease H [Synechococcaceae cyanobacterium]|nr:ribonuclease H [Synechococcaceae cyanobacterium]